MDLFRLIPDSWLLLLSAWLARRQQQQDLLDERTNRYGLNFDGPDTGPSPTLVPTGGGPKPIIGRAAQQLLQPES